MHPPKILLLSGWQNSVPTHWISRWAALYGDERVDQSEWMQPLRGDWVARLEEVLLAHAAKGEAPCVLAAHSLGCLLVAAWAAVSRNTHLVQAALLVAPGDPQGEELRDAPLHSWRSVALHRLPFRSVLLGSHNDPYCSLERARAFADAWGSEFVDYGHAGHINADSGLGDWPDGRARLAALVDVSA